MASFNGRRALQFASASSVLMIAPAHADLTGTVAATSEYMFRGIESSDGAAVQGSLNYNLDSGFYAGVWGSNIDEALGSSEVDVYGGWSGDLGGVGIDVGALQYLFPETNEDDALDNTDYVELYAGASLGGLSVKAFVTDDFFNTDEDAIYVTGAYTFDIKDDLALTAQAGWNDGDGVDAFVGDSYIDYSLTLAKSLENDFGVSFALINTTLDETESAIFASDDSPKFVLSLSKGFDL
ncbi:MAG: TorF family putative porin [Gammaproteobacteria bacterium]